MIRGPKVVDLMLAALRRERATRRNEPLSAIVRDVWNSHRASVDPIAMAALRGTGQLLLDRERTADLGLLGQSHDLALLGFMAIARERLKADDA